MSSPPPMFVADQPALDFLNTVFILEGEPIDVLQSDDDVARWLVAAKLLAQLPPLPARKNALLTRAHALRDTVRELVHQRRAGKRLQLAELNAFLALAPPTLAVAHDRGGAPRLEQRFGTDTPEQILMPLALSAVELLVDADFSLVRTCESEDCVLQFYDRTKSHRRRWCSMATCGNRHKVQTFRARQAERAK